MAIDTITDIKLLTWHSKDHIGISDALTYPISPR